MLLKHNPDVQTVPKYPIRESSRVGAPHRLEDDRGRASIRTDHSAGVEVVPSVGDHELEDVGIPELRKVLPMISSFHAGRGALHVDAEHDPGNSKIRRYVERPPGLDDGRYAPVRKPADEFHGIVLEERLASGEADMPSPVPGDLGHQGINGTTPPRTEGVRRIAPTAPEIATRRPDERRANPGQRPLPLERVEDLDNPHQTR